MTFKGKKHTEEYKENMRKKSMGNKSNLGRKFTEEHKKNLSESIKKNHANVSGENNPFFNKNHTEKTRQQMRDNHADFWGDKNPFYGKHHTEENKQKNRERNSGGNNPNSGKPLSEEHKQKIRASNLGILPSPKAGRGKRSYYDSLLQGQVCFRSSYELAYAKYLDTNNIPWLYETQTFDLYNTTYTPDFYLPTSNLFIEIKGYMTDKAQDKINKFLDIYHDETLQILRKDDLVKLGVLK